eukprot:scaffold2345_cov51-Attheya_sp.AAC.3
MWVALVGSSGGGSATLGHTDPAALLRTIQKELSQNVSSSNPDSEGPRLRHALFLSVDRGLDGLLLSDTDHDVHATLYAIGCRDEDPKLESNEDVRMVLTGPLARVNQVYQQLDEEFIARDIQRGLLQGGLISVSSDPKGVNRASFRQAGVSQIPVTGSGGSSLSTAVALHHVRLVGNAGGSVATTSYTRAISYVNALVTSWDDAYEYHPLRLQRDEIVPSLRSILDSCLPAFLAVVLACRFCTMLLSMLSHFSMIRNDDPRNNQYTVSAIIGEWLLERNISQHLVHILSTLQNYALPAVCAAVTTTAQAPELGSLATMGGAVVGAMCGSSSILAALAGGWLVARLQPRTLGLGFAFGCIYCYGSKVGWYHSFFLPVILLETEHGNASFWGAIDECTLVLVSAGICAANVCISPYRRTCTNDVDSVTSVCKRGVAINLLCGDFIECAYPFMEAFPLINISGYIASGVATEILFHGPVLSSAYLPLPMSIWLSSHNWKQMTLASACAFGVAFMGTILSNFWNRLRNHTAKKQN